jgi:hypothetical protein
MIFINLFLWPYSAIWVCIILVFVFCSLGTRLGSNPSRGQSGSNPDWVQPGVTGLRSRPGVTWSGKEEELIPLNWFVFLSGLLFPFKLFHFSPFQILGGPSISPFVYSRAGPLISD